MLQKESAAELQTVELSEDSLLTPSNVTLRPLKRLTIVRESFIQMFSFTSVTKSAFVQFIGVCAKYYKWVGVCIDFCEEMDSEPILCFSSVVNKKVVEYFVVEF